MKRNICIALFITLALLNVYDIFSTNTLLTSEKGFYEFNPLMRSAMDKMGLLPALVITKGAALLWVLSFLIRAKTKNEWSMLMAGLAMATYHYTVVYSMNYQSMLLLGRA